MYSTWLERNIMKINAISNYNNSCKNNTNFKARFYKSTIDRLIRDAHSLEKNGETNWPRLYTLLKFMDGLDEKIAYLDIMSWLRPGWKAGYEHITRINVANDFVSALDVCGNLKNYIYKDTLYNNDFNTEINSYEKLLRACVQEYYNSAEGSSFDHITHPVKGFYRMPQSVFERLTYENRNITEEDIYKFALENAEENSEQTIK